MTLRLELRHYETVVAIVELGSMTAAAKRLHTTQSALSHRLADAERRLGVKLFDRGAQRRLKPTRAGLVVHQSASRALAELERSESMLRTDDADVHATVRIGVGAYDAYQWFPAVVEAARDVAPSIELHLVKVGDHPSSALAAGAADLVLAPGSPEGNVVTRPVFDDELVCVVAPGHPFVALNHVTPDDLADQMYLTYNSAPAPGFEYDRFIRPAGSYPRTVTVVPQTNAVVEMVAAGAGVSILSRWALTPVIDAGRVIPRQCGPSGLPLPWVLLQRPEDGPGSPPSVIADLLVATLG